MTWSASRVDEERDLHIPRRNARQVHKIDSSIRRQQRCQSRGGAVNAQHGARRARLVDMCPNGHILLPIGRSRSAVAPSTAPRCSRSCSGAHAGSRTLTTSWGDERRSAAIERRLGAPARCVGGARLQVCCLPVRGPGAGAPDDGRSRPLQAPRAGDSNRLSQSGDVKPDTSSQIRQAREAKGWSQQHLATLVGKSQQWVAFIERGQRKIQPQDQLALRTLLGFDSTQR